MKQFFGILLAAVLVISVSFNVQAQTKKIDPANGKIITYYSSLGDTLQKTVYGDSILVFNAGGKFENVQFIVRDSLNSKTDSLVIEQQAPDGRWFAIGARNLYSGSVESTIVPGDGVQRGWQVLPSYAKYYRIRRVNVEWVTGRKTFIHIVAVAP